MAGAALLAAGLAIPAVALLALAGFLVSFFRDPDRRPPPGEETILSPADGTVLSVREAREAPAGSRRRLSIFMSVFNCHVNRSPVTGRLGDYAYVSGKKGVAFAEKASAENEQNRATIVTPQGGVTFKQIAGTLARRIVFYPRVGEELQRGQRIGLIRFGSRVDLFVPDDAEPLVKEGDAVRAGLTPVARWRGKAPGGARP